MKKRLINLRALLMLLVLSFATGAWATEVTWVAANQGYENGVQYKSATVDNYISLAFGDGGNDGKYYTTGSGIRLYANGHMTVSATGATITKIVVTYSGTSNTGTMSADTGTYTLNSATGTWTGSATSVTLTNTATSGHARIQKVAVTYTKTGSSKTETTTSFPNETYTAYLEEAFTSPTATVKAGEITVTTPAVTYSSSVESVATVDDNGTVTLKGTGTTIIKASYAGDDTYDASTAQYSLTVGKVYSNLAALVASGAPTATAVPVKVTLTDEVIQSIVLNKDETSRLGIMLKSGERDIEIFKTGVPEAWVANGTVSGTIEGTWKLYSSTWEVEISDWNQLTYTAPEKANPTLTLGTYKTTLQEEDTDEFTVTYDGDGTLSVYSSDEEVAEVEISSNNVSVYAYKVGSTTITISAPATDNYNAVSKTYTLKVTGLAAIPFSFDGGKADIATTKGMSQTGLGDDYTSSPKLKFDGANDNLVINYKESAAYLQFTIKVNGDTSGKKDWDGVFDVLESSDGTTYTTVKSYTSSDFTFVNYSATATGNYSLKPESRYVKFVYNTKTVGNVGLGDISIINEYSRNVTKGKYGTICLPYAVNEDNIAGADFYTAAINGDYVVLTEASSLEAGKPYILMATDDIIIAQYSGSPAAATTNGCLTGVITTTKLAAGDLVMQTKDGEQKFYTVAKGSEPTLSANKAYIKAADAAGAKGLSIGFEETDGINAINALVNGDAKIYDINGRQLQTLQKGINIVNGVKVLVK